MVQSGSLGRERKMVTGTKRYTGVKAGKIVSAEVKQQQFTYNEGDYNKRESNSNQLRFQKKLRF